MQVKKRIIVVVFVVALVLFFFRIYQNDNKRKHLKKNSKYTLATIVDVRKKRRSRIDIKYEFKVGDKYYIGVGNGVIQKVDHKFLYSVKIGQKYYVIYDSINPLINSILPYYRETQPVIVPDNGWQQYPKGDIPFQIK